MSKTKTATQEEDKDIKKREAIYGYNCSCKWISSCRDNGVPVEKAIFQTLQEEIIKEQRRFTPPCFADRVPPLTVNSRIKKYNSIDTFETRPAADK